MQASHESHAIELQNMQSQMRQMQEVVASSSMGSLQRLQEVNVSFVILLLFFFFNFMANLDTSFQLSTVFYYPTILVTVQKARKTSTNIPRYCTVGYYKYSWLLDSTVHAVILLHS